MSIRYNLLAIVCYLLIPVVLIVGIGLFMLINPEMARGQADYVRNYALLEWVRTAVLMAAGALALVLWLLTGYWLLKARHRSWRWWVLMAGGTFGLIALTLLEDLTPAANDAYQQFVQKLRQYQRWLLQIMVWIVVWVLPYSAILLQRELMMNLAAQQDAADGMWAFGEALEISYLAGLIAMLWPIAFNLASWLRLRLR